MTAPTINGTRYPQPVDELLPAARKLADELGEVPSRNRLMTEYRIGAPKAAELRTRLIEDKAREIVRRDIEQERAKLAGTDPAEQVRAALNLAERRGHVPTVDELSQVFDINLGKAAALADLVRMARRRVGLPTEPDPIDIDLDGSPAALVDEPEPVAVDPLPAPVVPEAVPVVEPGPTPAQAEPAPEPSTEVTVPGHPGTPDQPATGRRAAVWPVVLLAAPAFVAVWSGWVGLGKLTGFGMVDLLPGIVEPGSWATIDSAITLPVGVETYAAYALYVWLSGQVPDRARRFARWSAIGSLTVGALGQVAYHLLVAAGVTSAPWQITTAVACLPVAVLGMGAALAHLVREDVTK